MFLCLLRRFRSLLSLRRLPLLNLRLRSSLTSRLRPLRHLWRSRLWLLQTRLRWRSSARLSLRALWPHDFTLRLLRRRLSHTRTLCLLRSTPLLLLCLLRSTPLPLLCLLLSTSLSLLLLDCLFPLLLFKLLQLSARVSVPFRCLSSKRGFLLFARSISRLRNKLSWSLTTRSLSARVLTFVPHVPFLILNFVRHCVDAQVLRQVSAEWVRRRCSAYKNSRVVKFLRYSRRQIYLPSAPGGMYHCISERRQR